MSGDTITLANGRIVFAQLAKPYQPTDKEGNPRGNPYYVVRVEIDATTASGQKTMSDIQNAVRGKIITRELQQALGHKLTVPEGKFHVEAKSQFAPKVLDETGQILGSEENPIPFFDSRQDSGNAVLQVQPWTSSDPSLKDTLYLKGALLNGMKLTPRQESSDGGSVNIEAMKAALQDAASA